MDNAKLTEVPTPSSDEALQFDLGEYTIGWRPSGLALQRASEKGMELGEILADLQALFDADIDAEELAEEDLESGEEVIEEIDTTGFSNLTGVYAKLIWLGALHFEREIKIEAILALIDPEAIEDLPIGLMLDRAFPAIQDEAEEETDEDDTAGK